MQPDPILWSARPHVFRPAQICIGLADTEPNTYRIADAIAGRLHARGFVADVFGELRRPPPDADAYVLGSPTTQRSLDALARFVSSARADLSQLATAMFLVRHDRKREPALEIREVLDRLAWRPDLVAVLDADEPHHGALVRWVMHHVLPHWEWSVASATDAVRLADAIAIGLIRAAELHLTRPTR
jgi:hypothetical protein